MKSSPDCENSSQVSLCDVQVPYMDDNKIGAENRSRGVSAFTTKLYSTCGMATDTAPLENINELLKSGHLRKKIPYTLIDGIVFNALVETTEGFIPHFFYINIHKDYISQIKYP